MKTFFSVFIILMFIFVLQSIWLYIGELAGKDLDIEVIFKFLLYMSPKLVPLVLPLSILLSSIMTFGDFAENYELAAMKSSGFSLQRAMRSLIFFILLVSVTAFVFANNVIPYAEYKAINLRKNIAQMKPAMAISEGVFNEVGNVNIKVAEKFGDNDQYLRDVVIHQKSGNRPGNFTVIKANEGELVGSEGSDILSLILFDGNYYDEIQTTSRSSREKMPFAKSYFEEYTINMDLSSFNDVDLEEERYSNSHNMLKISELSQSIDSFSTTYNTEMGQFAQNMYSRSGITRLNYNLQPADTVEVSIQDNILELYEPDRATQIINLAMGNINGAAAALLAQKTMFTQSEQRLNKFEIALHEKYVLGFACVILFFVGAPLGAIIRKGGMGLPMVVAIVLFLTYHFIGMFAKNSAENGALNPFLATWLSTFIMLPLGIILTYRATTDRGLFSFDSITQPIKRFLKKTGIIKEN